MGTSTLRPDLILARGEEAIILDVTVLFENRRAALLEGRRRPTSTNRSGTTSSSGTSGRRSTPLLSEHWVHGTPPTTKCSGDCAAAPTSA